MPCLTNWSQYLVGVMFQDSQDEVIRSLEQSTQASLDSPLGAPQWYGRCLRTLEKSLEEFPSTLSTENRLMTYIHMTEADWRVIKPSDSWIASSWETGNSHSAKPRPSHIHLWTWNIMKTTIGVCLYSLTRLWNIEKCHKGQHGYSKW